MLNETETETAPAMDAPEQVFDYTGPAGEQGPNGDQEDLPDELIASLQSICAKLDQEDLQSRIRLVCHVQKTRFFQRGEQYLERGKDNEGGVYSPKYMDASVLQDGEDRDPMYVFNIYWQYGRSFTATFAQASVGVSCEANDPNNPSDITASKEGDNAKKIVTKVNNQRDLQKQIAKLLWTDPYVVFEVSDSAHGAKFGYDKEGNPRRYPQIRVAGALEWKVPIACGCYDNWPYMRHQEEIALVVGKEEYPDKKKKIAGGGNIGDKGNDYSRQARLSTQEGLQQTQQSGDAQAFMATRTRYFLRPSAFNEEGDDQKQATLRQWFPDGALVTFVGDTYVRSVNVDLGDRLAIMKGDPGEGYATPGLGDILLGPQESFNDLANLARITFLRGVPSTYFNQDATPPEAIAKQRNAPGAMRPVDPSVCTPGEPISNLFFQEQPASPSPGLQGYMEDLKGVTAQSLSGQQPALYGGEMGEAGKTAAGYGQALSQAMGQMTIVWVPFKMVWAQVIRQAISLLAELYGQEEEISTTLNAGTSDSEQVTLTPNNLKGRLLTSPDCDENFPESWSMQRANLQGVLPIADKDPTLAKMLSRPNNLRRSKNLLGLKDYEDPDEDMRDEVMADIEQLLEEPPVPTPEAAQAVKQAMLAGQPLQPAAIAALPMQSSVDPDPEFGDPSIAWATCNDWWISPQGRKVRKANPQGAANVRLYSLAWKKLMQQAQQGPQGKPPSTSIAFKDLPMDGKIQLAAEAGLHLTPPPPPQPAPPGPAPILNMGNQAPQSAPAQ